MLQKDLNLSTTGILGEKSHSISMLASCVFYSIDNFRLPPLITNIRHLDYLTSTLGGRSGFVFNGTMHSPAKSQAVPGGKGGLFRNKKRKRYHNKNCTERGVSRSQGHGRFPHLVKNTLPWGKVHFTRSTTSAYPL